MAFMMPVMKNEFDIYKGGRSRRISECSNGSACRSRKVSECRSECPSLSTSPGNEFMATSPSHRQQYQMHRTSSRPFSRTSSRTSQNSFVMSPTKGSQASSPPKVATNSGSQGSLNKFHTRLVDKLRRSLRKDSSTDRSWEYHKSSYNDLDNNVLETGVSSTPYFSSTQNLLNQNLITSTKALKIIDNADLEDDVESTYRTTSRHRRTSAPSTHRRRGSPTPNTSIDIGVASSSTGDIHSTIDTGEQLHKNVLIRSKPPLPQQTYLLATASTIAKKKKKSFFRRLRHGTCSAPR